jgi:hypothetical protein
MKRFRPLPLSVIETEPCKFTVAREEIEAVSLPYLYCVRRILSDKKAKWDSLLMAKELMAAREARKNLHRLVKERQLNFLSFTPLGMLLVKIVARMIQVAGFLETEAALLESPGFPEIFGPAERVPVLVPGADGDDPYFRSAVRAVSEVRGFRRRRSRPPPQIGPLAASVWFAMFEQAFFDEADRAGHHSGVPLGPALLGPESAGKFRQVGGDPESVGFCARTCCADSFVGAHPSETARFWLLLELYFPSIEPDSSALRRPRFYVDCYNALIAALTVARRAVPTLPAVAPPPPPLPVAVPPQASGKRKRGAEVSETHSESKKAKLLVAGS